MNDVDWGAIIGPAMQAAANYSAGRQVGKAGEAAAANADPFAQYRPQYANALAELQRNPSSVQSTPGYRFAFDQGQQALERSAAAKGMLGSGNVLAELQRYGQGMAEQQFGKEREFLAKASGAYLDPSEAAKIGLKGRMDQLGAYNQATGQLLSDGRSASQPGSAGTVNSLMNLYKAGKKAYDAWGATGGATSGGSELGSDFSSWADSQPGYYGDYGGYASNWGYGDAIDSGAMDSFQAGTDAASTGGYAGAAGNAFGAAGQGLGYLGAANSLANILQGDGGVMDYWKTGKTAYDLYNAYAAGQVGAGAGAAGAAAGTGTAAGAGTATTATAAGGAGTGVAGAATGALGMGIVALGAYFGEKEGAKQQKRQLGEASETWNNLAQRGIDMSKLDPSNWYKPIDELGRFTPGGGLRNVVDTHGDKTYGIDTNYLNSILGQYGGDAQSFAGRDIHNLGRDLLVQTGYTNSSPFMQKLAEMQNKQIGSPAQPVQYNVFGGVRRSEWE